jgi:hypothetical protein
MTTHQQTRNSTAMPQGKKVEVVYLFISKKGMQFIAQL